MIRQLIILTLGLILMAGGYFVYQNMNKPVPVQPQKEIISNIKIGKYETLYKGGWEELNYIDTANAKNPEELYEVFSKTYPDLTDNNSEFFIREIIIKDDTAEVYFGGDEGAITDRMGTTGPYNYSGLVTFALTEDEKIKKVDFKLKTEGSHFGPRISTRDDFIYLWPTQLLEEIASNSKHARIALASRKRLSDETSDWKTYINTNLGISFKYPASYVVKESPNLIIINNQIQITFIIGVSKYFGCAYPSDRCPKSISTQVNGKIVYKHEGTENSIGGKNLLEYEFKGKNPNTAVDSTDTEYHLFFNYIGDNSDKNSLEIFNSIINTVQYKYGQEPGPST